MVLRNSTSWWCSTGKKNCWKLPKTEMLFVNKITAVCSQKLSHNARPFQFDSNRLISSFYQHWLADFSPHTVPCKTSRIYRLSVPLFLNMTRLTFRYRTTIQFLCYCPRKVLLCQAYRSFRCLSFCPAQISSWEHCSRLQYAQQMMLENGAFNLHQPEAEIVSQYCMAAHQPMNKSIQIGQLWRDCWWLGQKCQQCFSITASERGYTTKLWNFSHSCENIAECNHLWPIYACWKFSATFCSILG